MKPKTFSLFALGVVLFSFASSAPAVAAETAAPNAAVATAADPLEQLVAPIALYPDVLIALLLPASTESADVVLAARFLEGGGNSAEIDAQPWDESVKGLARYPDVLKWMDENLSWTRQLGDAYLESSDKVMAAIQRVRARAKANGLLVSTTEQQVVEETGYIRIVPAQPNVVYVPRYEPEILYLERPIVYHTQPWITFGAAFGVGWWLNYDCDWGSRVIVVNPHYRQHWRHGHDWRHHRFAHRGDHHYQWRRWAPSHRHPPHQRHFRHHPGREFARPTPHPGAPRQHWNHRPGWERRNDHGDRNRERFSERRGARERRDSLHERTQPPSHLRGGGPRGFAVEPPQPRTAPRQRDGNWERRRERDGNGRGNGNEHRQRFTPPAPAATQPQPQPQVAIAPPVRRSAPENHSAMRQGGGERRFNSAPRPAAPQVAASRPQPVAAPRVSQPARSDSAVRPAPRMAPSGGGREGGGGGGQRGNRGGPGRSER